MPGNSFRQKHPKNKQTKLHLVFDESSRRTFLTGFHKRKLERKKFHQQKLEDAKREEQKQERREKKKAFEESMKNIRFPEPVKDDEDTAKVHDLEDHTVTVTAITSIDLVEAHGGVGENKVEYETEETGYMVDESGEDVNDLLEFPVKELRTPESDLDVKATQSEVTGSRKASSTRKPSHKPESKKTPTKEKQQKKKKKRDMSSSSMKMKKKKLSKMSTAKKRALKQKRGRRK